MALSFADLRAIESALHRHAQLVVLSNGARTVVHSRKGRFIVAVDEATSLEFECAPPAKARDVGVCISKRL